jgi:hypothetical protein
MRRRPGAARPAAPGVSVLPPLYARWIDDLLGAPIEPETNATCSDCAMCAAAGAPPDPGGLYFKPTVKCCSFWPILPNFLVGRILRDAAPERARGRASVEARIAAGIAVTPLGLGRTAAQTCPDPAFGQDEAFLCPHFIPDGGGTCGIWPHREATCTTFFCKFVRGAVGAEFWRALQRLLEAIEQALGWHCLEALDPGSAALARLLDPAGNARPLVMTRPDGTYAPEDRRALWGRWTDREPAFYEAAAEVVERVSWRDIQEHGGPELRLRARVARDAHARLRAPAIPAGPLRLGTFVVTDRSPDAVRLASYSASDLLSIPPDLLDVLPAFNERPALEALDKIEAEHGLDIEPAVVGRLLDFEVLVPAPAPPARTG